MKNKKPLMKHQDLNKEEFEQLSDYLEQHAQMNIEKMDGFFSALACSPEFIMPSNFFPHIFGEEHSFDNEQEAGDIIGLILQHWNTVVSELSKSQDDEEQFYFPIILEDEHGIATATEWVNGFMSAVYLRLEAWQPLLDDEENAGPLLPILALYHEHNPDPEYSPGEITPERREKFMAYIIAGLPRIYAYFRENQPQQQKAMPFVNPLRSHKIGRNDLCHCGSGLKYKRCCYGKEPTIH